jgi:hypothetical protein
MQLILIVIELNAYVGLARPRVAIVGIHYGKYCQIGRYRLEIQRKAQYCTPSHQLGDHRQSTTLSLFRTSGAFRIKTLRGFGCREP